MEFRDIPISEVWHALGGGRLRKAGKQYRGRAFWRGSPDWNVSLDLERNLWYDFARATGGDQVALVAEIQGYAPKTAIEWLERLAGISGKSCRQRASADPHWRRDLEEAQAWRVAAEALAEMELENEALPTGMRRRYTQLLAAMRLGDASLVAAFRDCRKNKPELTAGMLHAGHEYLRRQRLAAAQAIQEAARQ